MQTMTKQHKLLSFSNCKYLLLILFFTLNRVPASADSLRELISSALTTHPSIRSYRASERAADANVANARWQFYPTASVSYDRASVSKTDVSHTGDNTVTILGLQQPLWTWGRLSAGLDRAKADVSISHFEAELGRQEIALQVVQNFGDWQAALLNELALQRSLVAHQDLQQLVTRRVAQGLSAESDQDLATSRLESTKEQVSSIQLQKEIALSRLAQLLGHSIEEESLSQERPLGEGESDSLQSLFLSLKDHPSILRLQAMVRQSNATIAERKADYKPEFYVRAERQIGNYSFGNSRPENRVFFGFNSRFGAGLSSVSRVNEARARREAALAEVEAQTRILNEQVSADFLLLSSVQERLIALEVSLDTAISVAASYERQFLAGRKSWLDVINSEREIVQTEGQIIDLTTAQLVVSWRLAISSQGLCGVGLSQC